MNQNLNVKSPSVSIVYIMLGLFIITSLTDVATTYIGLTSGFAEQTEFVNQLWMQFGFLGLIISKVIAVFGVSALAAPFYFADKKMTMYFLSVLYLMGTIVFGYATIHNLNLLGYI